MKTIVALLDTFQDARDAARDLEATGFKRDQLSLVAQRDVLGADEEEGSATASGAVIGAGFGLLAGLAAVTIPGIGVVAALGPIIAGGVVGAVAGGLVGSLVDAGVREEDARCYTEGVRRGGTLVSLMARDTDAARAVEVINRHNPVDLNERMLDWRRSGWAPDAEAVAAPGDCSAGTARPDATGQTTMGDEIAAMPAATSAIPVPGIQPTHELEPHEQNGPVIEPEETRVDFTSIRL